MSEKTKAEPVINIVKMNKRSIADVFRLNNVVSKARRKQIVFNEVMSKNWVG